MRRSYALVMLGLLAGTGWQAAGAQEPAHFAVMGVRLYMSAPEVLGALYAQGVSRAAVTEHSHPCALHPAASCTDTITAPLADGPIVVRFAEAPAGFNDGREAAYRIAYTVLGRGPSDAGLVRSAAEDRYGLGSSSTDQWCAQASSSTTTCPDEAPRLAFAAGSAEAGVLTLSDLGLPARLAGGFTSAGLIETAPR